MASVPSSRRPTAGPTNPFSGSSICWPPERPPSRPPLLLLTKNQRELRFHSSPKPCRLPAAHPQGDPQPIPTASTRTHPHASRQCESKILRMHELAANRVIESRSKTGMASGWSPTEPRHRSGRGRCEHPALPLPRGPLGWRCDFCHGKRSAQPVRSRPGSEAHTLPH